MVSGREPALNEESKVTCSLNETLPTLRALFIAREGWVAVVHQTKAVRLRLLAVKLLC